jgi:hypothetical protein
MAGCLLRECVEWRVGASVEEGADDADCAYVVAEHGRALDWIELGQGNNLGVSSSAQLDLAGGTGVLDQFVTP